MRRNKWFQFSLMGLVLLLTGACIGLGLTVHAKHCERRATEVLERSGAGTLGYLRLRGWPRWFINLLGEEHFRHVFYVEFGDDSIQGVGDAELDSLRYLPFLEEVRFIDVRVSDKGIETLTKLDNLQQVVFMHGAKASVNGAEILKRRFPNVQKRANARSYQKMGYDSWTPLPSVLD